MITRAVVAAVAIFSIGMLAVFVRSIFLNGPVRALVSRNQSEMRSISMGLESYKIDHGVYPPSLNNLTTPIAYLRSIP